MIEKMRQAASTLENDYIRKWKKGDNKVVGYSCTFIPEEILHAAGVLPFRLRGLGTTNLSIGDSYFGPVNCSFPKCMLQLAGQGSYGFLDGAIISNGCDSMRRLEECWRKASEDYPGTLPGYYEYFSVPHKAVDYSIDFYEKELGDMIATLENHFKVKIRDKDLRDSIRVYNEGRALLREIDGLRYGATTPITGADAMAILIAGHAIPRESFNEELKGVIKDLRKAPTVSDGKKRLMLIGSANDDLDFVGLVEDGKAVVMMRPSPSVPLRPTICTTAYARACWATTRTGAPTSWTSRGRPRWMASYSRTCASATSTDRKTACSSGTSRQKGSPACAWSGSTAPCRRRED